MISVEKRGIPPRRVRRTLLVAVACLFGLCLVARPSLPVKKAERPKDDERVYLVHADRLRYDQYGDNPRAQVLNGNVEFHHKGARLLCDSAYFYQESNSLRAFSNVRMYQGDTLSLLSDYSFYDGNEQMAYSRYNVVLTHRQTKLYTDSLNYDRLYGLGYFFEGGKMVDKDNVLVSDWGEYDTETRESVFYYDVTLRNPKYVMETDTLYYDTNTSVAHVVGPSKIVSDQTTIITIDGFYDTENDRARLYERSTLVNEGKEITADSLFYDENSGISEGFQNVVYDDKLNRNQFTGEYIWYNDITGAAIATDRAVMKDYSQNDTLFMHSDTMRVYTFNLDTDSMFRKVHCYNKVRAYRTDVQAVCDSLVYNTQDSCMTMYRDPITWSDNRQLLGEVIEVYLKDSTIDRSHVINQAMSIEQIPGTEFFNQVSSREMFGYFDHGEISRTDAIGNVLASYYIEDDKDSSYVDMVYIETDTIRMYMQDRQLYKMWASKNVGNMYPVTQTPPGRARLPAFAWFDYVRPVDKYDIFNWRGKKEGTELREISRHSAPLQHIGADGVVSESTEAGTSDVLARLEPVDTVSAGLGAVPDSLGLEAPGDTIGIGSPGQGTRGDSPDGGVAGPQAQPAGAGTQDGPSDGAATVPVAAGPGQAEQADGGDAGESQGTPAPMGEESPSGGDGMEGSEGAEAPLEPQDSP